MKIKEGFILREVASSYIVVSVGNNDFKGMITLNQMGALIWEELTNGLSIDQIKEKFLNEYEVSEEVVTKDVANFVKTLVDNNIVE